ncbi:hypothetical protein EXIGLDRAFT_709905 [Exidia glandulosa HHB12029]|uniref:Phosphoesterase-domain-containing protein n=1 Tax=Exidia glandulosa HHB12029 TaxID=1314781 RepID=A0A165P4F2_EXIGL|nr:hypothetical protein EXIGLDRAFT_709905 [Exidia glandulosa HHB12029]
MLFPAAVSVALVLGAAPAFAAIAQSFSPPASSPTSQSSNYTGASNNTLTNSPLVPGKAFDRFIQIWLENTDFATAASSPVFQTLAKQGITLTQYYALTHPSEPNYCAAAGGDFFGMHDDNFYSIPKNISTIVDLLDAKDVSWATYQENLPFDGYTGFNYTQTNYFNASAGQYAYYVRKHNPVMFYNSVMGNETRGLRVRNFNDFANDLNANKIPQWSFITPNMVNDAHDTTIDFAADWLQFWLMPLLGNKNFNTNRTLILLTFDESETAREGNRLFTLLLGGSVPTKLHGTNDTLYYTHYSALSTVENNWGLGSLGRGDTNATLSNVFTLVANATGYTKNVNVTNPPQNNDSGMIPGPLNPAFFQSFTAPNTSATGAGGGPVFVGPGVDMSFTKSSLPAPVDLSAPGAGFPFGNDPGFDYSSGKLVIVNTTSSSSSSTAAGGSSTAAAGGTSTDTAAGSTATNGTGSTGSAATNVVSGPALTFAAVLALAFAL